MIKDLKKYNFDKVFIFNSSLRFNLIANYQKYRDLSISIIKKTNQHIINTAKNFIEAKLNIHVSEDPKIQIKQELLLKATDE